MSVTILHKNSDVPAAAPSKADITLGELAINTHDADVYFKKLIDPALGDTAENTVIYSARRPLVADGGEIVA